MKKLLILISMSIVLTTVSTFGQAYFSFYGRPPVWDDTVFPATTDAGFDVVFLLGTVGETPLVSGIMSGTPTNNLSIYFSNTAAWQDVLTDPNFTIAGTSAGGTVTDYVATGNTNRNGGFFFYSSRTAPDVPVTGTTVGTTYALVVVAWNTEGGALTTPQEAAAAGAPIGWSPVFDYVAGPAPPAIPTPGFDPTAFGIWATPEPTTLTLAGLGAISMIFMRRREG